MNFTLFPDVLVNTEGQVGLISQRADWVITQADRTGEIKITLKDRNCYDAYHLAKSFGINVDKKWWQIWRATPNVSCSDKRLDECCSGEW